MRSERERSGKLEEVRILPLPSFLPPSPPHTCRCELDAALAVYSSAALLARDQREVEHIALYEKGQRKVKRLLF